MAARKGRRPKTEYHPTPELLTALQFFATQGMKAGSYVSFLGGKALFDNGSARYFRYLPSIDWRISIDGHRLLKAIEGQTESLSFTPSDECTKLTIASLFGIDEIPCAPFGMPIAEPQFWQRLPDGAAADLIAAGKLGKSFDSEVHLRKGALVLSAHGFGAVMQSQIPNSVPDKELSAAVLARLAKCKPALVGLGWVNGNPNAISLFFGTGQMEATAMQLGIEGADPRPTNIHNFITERGEAKGRAQEMPPSFWRALREIKEGAQDDLVHFSCETEPTISSGGTRRAVGLNIPAPAVFPISGLLALEGVAHTIEFEPNGTEWCMWFRGPGVVGCLFSIQLGEVTAQPESSIHDGTPDDPEKAPF